MSNIVIRALTPADEPVLWEMLYWAIHVPAGHELPPREIVYEPKIAHYVAGWGKRVSDLGVGAWDGDRAAGAAWLRQLYADDLGYGYVDDATPELTIALLPEYRGQAIGTRLLSELLARAAERCDAVSLSVSPDNRARQLYERIGFRVVGDDGSSLIMLKQFTPSS